MLVGDLADDHARCGDARRGVDRTADPRPGDLLGHLGSEQVRQDQIRQPRHEVDHRNDDDQHQRNDVRELFVVAARHARRRDAGRNAADRDAARKDHRRTFVNLHAAREPEGEEPHDSHHEACLHESEDARLHHVAEKNRGAEAHHADLDEELALNGGLHPRGNAPHVADQEAEQHREKDRFEAVVGHGRNLGHDLRQQRNGEDDDQRRQQPLERAPQQQAADVEHRQHDGEQVKDIVPGHLAHEGRGDARQVGGDERRKQQQRNRDPDHHPVLDAKLFDEFFHSDFN